MICDNCSTEMSVQMWGSLGSWKDNSCSPFTEMETLCSDCLFKKFSDIIEKMDIPVMRKTDYRWLRRNMFIRNKEHENFNQAEFYLKAIIRKLQ